MKKISIALLAALSLVAVAGCKKKGGDCKATISAAIDRAIAQEMKTQGDKVPAKMKDMAKKMAEKMKGVMIKSCTDDKWSSAALKCIADAKTNSAMQKCDDKLTKKQKDNVEKAMKSVMMGAMSQAAGAAMADKGATPPAGSGSASGAAPAAGAASGGGDLPKECQDYKAAIDKLANCNKLPQATRDAMKKAYDQASAAWAKVPASAKASLATACKAGLDAVNKSGKAVCGW